ncbi:AI-2E family transporter [bacterium]|nr:AI-2E family transporter [bacterium]RQV98252.1 MAG: AI-2E family transporter [bacterium]
MNDTIKQSSFFVGIVVFTLLAAYIYTVHQIISPILVSIILLFVLGGLKENPFARRISIAVWGLLVIWMFIKAQIIFFPFIVSYILAYLLDPIADFLEKKKIPRFIASLILVILVFGIIVTFGVLIIPQLVEEIQNLINSLPQVVESIQTKIVENLPKVLQFLRIEETEFKQNWTSTAPNGLQQIFNNLLKGLLGITSFLGQILNLIIIPVITFYILKDFNKIRQWFLDLFSRQHKPRVSYYLWRVNRIVGSYLRAQVLVCIFVGILTGFGLALAGIQFAILLGVLTGLLNFIPYIGLYVSLALSCFVAFLNPNPLLSIFYVALIFAFVQGLEGAIIQPKIVGDRVGLHPVAVMFSVLFFARFFGFWGLLIGVPTAAVVMFFINEWKRRQALSELFEERTLQQQ